MKTVLIIDDFASVRFYHQHLLRSAGFTAVTVADGQAALEALAVQRVDLVLLDLLMPRMGGAEFVQHLRRQPSHAALPVVVVTSEAGHPDLTDIKRDSACVVLTKPVLPATLLHAIRAHLN